MPIKKRWTKFTRANVEKIPEDKTGAYEIANKDQKIIYIGSSQARTGVRGRLINHIINNRFPSGKYFRCEFIGFLDWHSARDKERIQAEKYAQKRIRQTKPRRSKRFPRNT